MDKKNYFNSQPLILHACAVNTAKSEACIFLGKSGDGKTTTAKLADQCGLKVLSDELVCIVEKEKFFVTGTNVSSANCNVDISIHSKCNITAFCILEKYKEFQLYRNPNQKYFNILSSAVENSIFTNDILLTIFKLCNTLPFIHMRFFKNKIDWMMLNDFLGNKG